MHEHILLYSGAGRGERRTSFHCTVCNDCESGTRVDQQLAESYFKRRPNESPLPSRAKFSSQTLLHTTPTEGPPSQPKYREPPLLSSSSCGESPRRRRPRPRSTDGKPLHLGLGGRTADGWCALSVSSEVNFEEAARPSQVCCRRCAPARGAKIRAPRPRPGCTAVRFVAHRHSYAVVDARSPESTNTMGLTLARRGSNSTPLLGLSFRATHNFLLPGRLFVRSIWFGFAYVHRGVRGSRR